MLKLKVDEKGNVVLQDGKPVYIDDATGKEVELDANEWNKTIATLKLEAATNRTKSNELTERLKGYGDATPETVATAFKTLEELGGEAGITKLKEKGKVDVDAVKKAVSEAYEKQLKKATDDLTIKDAEIYKLLVSSQFAQSKFVQTKLVLPPDIAENTFGKSFKVEDGKVVAYLRGANGAENKILSTQTHLAGEPATFEEAIEVLVAHYPMKDRILKGDTQSGSGMNTGAGAGAGGGNGAGTGGGKPPSKMKRDEFEKLNPTEQMEFSKAKGVLV